MGWKWLMAFVAAVALCTAPVVGETDKPASTATTPIVEIEIVSEWAGILDYQRSALRIVWDSRKGAYRLKRKSVPAAAIEALHTALAMKRRNAPVAAEAGLTPEALRARTKRWTRAGPTERDALVARFLEAERCQEFVETLYLRSVVLDDNPLLTLRVRYRDGRSTTMVSDSPFPLMLPWKREDGKPDFNPELSRAVAALMPEKAPNQARLGTEYLLARYEQVFWNQVAREAGRSQ